MKHHALALLALASLTPGASADERGETSWEHAPSAYKTPAGLVRGGAFIDLILPMPPAAAGLRTDVWGAKLTGPRDPENGLESPDFSYWCMNVQHEQADGKEHMFAVRWPESSVKGHMAWPKSTVVHAVADSPTGPFRVIREIGPGHNVNRYRAKDGTQVLYVNGGGYSAKTVAGPWKPFRFVYDNRGTPSGEMTNHSFTLREDGSVLMISRGGRTWISEDGLKPYRKITDKSAYPPIKGEFEDPVVWRDEVQYHLIVNDWFGRTAFHLRSKDGAHWVWDAGVAYDTTVARRADGSRENWYKFERPQVRQDQYGRATHIYFAVIDTRKDLDRANDGHGSKIIAMPLALQRRLEILNPAPIDAATREIAVRIRAEAGFAPQEEVDTASLRFGAPTEVDFGRGCKPVATRADGADLIVTFEAAGNGFTSADFVGKLLGADRKGALLHGYARIPGQSYAEPMVDAPPVTFTPEGARVIVENFGLTASHPGKATLTVTGADGVRRTVEAAVPAIAPYASAAVTLPVDFQKLGDRAATPVELRLDCGGVPSVQRHTLKSPPAQAESARPTR